jgi:hypothetical protein
LQATSGSQKSGAQQSDLWEALRTTVKPGRTLVVTLADGTHVAGGLISINERTISIDQPRGTRTIAAHDVLRIRYAGVRSRHILKGMLIGALVGAVCVVAIDQYSSHPSTKLEAATLGALFIGVPGGALAGAALPVGPDLYDAPRDLPKHTEGSTPTLRWESSWSSRTGGTHVTHCDVWTEC